MGRKQKNIRLARSLRQACIPAERRLWKLLRDRRLAGFKFRRQHPIGPYVADFACQQAMLVIEVDGETHLSRKSQDERRTQFFESEGWYVQRFWNTEVYEEWEAVEEAIYRLCLQRTNACRSALTPNPSPPADRGLARIRRLKAGGEGRRKTPDP